MICGLKVLSIIPARGGSKGIINKNIIDLKGKPLIAYSIDASKSSQYVDLTVVSTDSEMIAEVAKNCGAKVPFLRPMEIADDNSKIICTVIHVIEELKKRGLLFDLLALLQPTQPLREAKDIDGALEMCIDKNLKSIVGVRAACEAPLLMRSMDENGVLTNIMNVQSTVRRQDMPNYYLVNGAIYINKISDINVYTSFNDNEIGYVMSKKSSVDIDTLEDLEMAEFYFRESK